MDIATLNYLGITLLALFGLWAFWKGGQAIQKDRQRDAKNQQNNTRPE
ncbi:MAG: hypothetical protein IJA79_05760 [Desulfovibrio sp.]|nr:hypothetical protein [Desulfovibrio sp.]